MSKTTMAKQGIVIGCRDVVFAQVTADASTGTTYGDIFEAPGVIEIALTANVTNENIAADDVPLYEVFTSLDGFEVSVTMTQVGNDGKAYLLGGTVDAKGVLLESSDDEAPYVAMGFKTARSDNSDDYIWLYKGKFAHGDSNFRTKERGAVNWQTPVLTGTFMPRISDKRVRAIVNSEDSSASTILSSFFSAPYETPTGSP